MTQPTPTRTFTAGQVLTLACADAEAQQLFCPYGDLLDALGYMLFDVPFPADVPAAIVRCRPTVLDMYPALRAVSPPSPNAPDAAVLGWINNQEQVLGAQLALRQVGVPDDQ